MATIGWSYIDPFGSTVVGRRRSALELDRMFVIGRSNTEYLIDLTTVRGKRWWPYQFGTRFLVPFLIMIMFITTIHNVDMRRAIRAANNIQDAT
jgi:hypothetical protein